MWCRRIQNYSEWRAVSAAAEIRKGRRGRAYYWPHRRLPGLHVAYDDCLYKTSLLLQSLTTGTVAGASGSDEVTVLSYLLSQYVGLVPGDEHQVVIHDFVAGCMCFGYGNGFATLRFTQRWTMSNLTCSLRQARVRQS